MLPLVAIGLLVLAALVGSGVDMARAYKAERRLQAACDAGALAGRHAVTTEGFDQTAQDQANAFFHANYNDAQQQTANTAFTPSSNDDGNTVVGTATTRLDTIIMKIFGFANFDLAVSCSSSMGVGNSDIIFVLDSTGSMNDEPDGTSPDEGEVSKLESLKVAMKAFYDTVATSVAASNARIRYGFVPYSSAVNLSSLVSEGDMPSGWFVTQGPYQTRLAVFDQIDYPIISQTTLKTEDITNWTFRNRSSCEAWAIIDPYIVSGAPPAKTTMILYELKEWNRRDNKCVRKETTVEREYGSTPFYRFTGWRHTAKNDFPTDGFISGSIPLATSVSSDATVPDRGEYDIRTLAGLSGATGITTTSSTWGGCIMERSTTPAESFSFTSLEAGITPEPEGWSLDIDGVPTSDNASKWRPLWPEITYRDASSLASSSCPYEARLLKTMTKGDFDGYADSLVAIGSTYHDIGLLWGARLSSPTGIFTDNVNEAPSNNGTVSRHVIFMTDGELAPTLSVNSSYGIERLDKRITGNGTSEPDQKARHRSRYLAICEAIKARGIRLWVIAFGDEVELSADLVTCATDGLASAFKADNADELNEHFQEIAKQVGELRLIQ